ncbi:MAG: sigma-70 family RNA polymerase sigma factor [Solirubrobacterales bacterium]|nr:sigma-70 family RNA polymerase sigma factor [Solirubrobacterales bacterium]
MLSGSEENRLVRAAAEGDGPAFARLYESYEKRIFNYLLRLLGDRHEAEDATQEAFIRVMAKLPELDTGNLQFGAYLYTSARNAGYDVIAGRKKLEPTGPVPDQAESPYRGELSDLESDPERSVLAGSQEEAVREANGRLPERQREVLALRELDGLSYDEIAGVMEMKPNAVSQLISRARISLRKEMRVGAAASVAMVSSDCERAHGEMACRQDGESGVDNAWLTSHLAGCPSCQVASEEMAEAGVSYRAWAPVLPAAWVFREVMARASEINGHDWSGVERPDSDGDEAVRDTQDPVAGANGTRRAVLVGAGSVIAACLLAFLLLAEANAPERDRAEEQVKLEQLSGKEQVAEEKSKTDTERRRDLVKVTDEPSDPGVTVPATGPGSTTPSGSGNTDSPGGSGSSGGSGGGGGNTGGSNGSPPANTSPDPVDPVDPPVPSDPAPTPDPVPEPEPNPTPIPGGPSGIAIPGGPKPG